MAPRANRTYEPDPGALARYEERLAAYTPPPRRQSEPASRFERRTSEVFDFEREDALFDFAPSAPRQPSAPPPRRIVTVPAPAQPPQPQGPRVAKTAPPPARSPVVAAASAQASPTPVASPLNDDAAIRPTSGPPRRWQPATRRRPRVTVRRAIATAAAVVLDINYEWVSFNTFGAPGSRGALKLLPGMHRPPTRYLTPDDRDFFAVYGRRSTGYHRRRTVLGGEVAVPCTRNPL